MNEYPGKQDFLQLANLGTGDQLLAIFGRTPHALSCFEGTEGC
jgi:hypothetical protein